MAKSATRIHYVAGVLAVKKHKDGTPRIALVTSSDGSMWVIPKGHIDPGETAPVAAAREAWEEAGIAGPLGAETLAAYEYDWKGRRYEVVVFRMDVEEIAESWPEAGRRKRKWFKPAKALEVVETPELVALIKALGKTSV